jgi:hypothetical protein
VRYLNALILAGLVLCGVALVGGDLLENGNLQWLGAYAGWFLAAYSIIAYVVASTLYALRGHSAYWTDLYAVNFALSLLGAATFGIPSARDAAGPAITVVASGAIGLLVARRCKAKIKLLPISMIVILAGALLESMAVSWVYIFVAAAGLLIGATLALAANPERDAAARA